MDQDFNSLKSLILRVDSLSIFSALEFPSDENLDETNSKDIETNKTTKKISKKSQNENRTDLDKKAEVPLNQANIEQKRTSKYLIIFFIVLILFLILVGFVGAGVYLYWKSVNKILNN